MQFDPFIEVLRIRAEIIRQPREYPKEQDAYLLEKAAEVIDRMLRVCKRNSKDPELMQRIHDEIDTLTEISYPPASSTSPTTDTSPALPQGTTSESNTSHLDSNHKPCTPTPASHASPPMEAGPWE